MPPTSKTRQITRSKKVVSADSEPEFSLQLSSSILDNPPAHKEARDMPSVVLLRGIQALESAFPSADARFSWVPDGLVPCFHCVSQMYLDIESMDCIASPSQRSRRTTCQSERIECRPIPDALIGVGVAIWNAGEILRERIDASGLCCAQGQIHRDQVEFYRIHAVLEQLSCCCQLFGLVAVSLRSSHGYTKDALMALVDESQAQTHLLCAMATFMANSPTAESKDELLSLAAQYQGNSESIPDEIARLLSAVELLVRSVEGLPPATSNTAMSAMDLANDRTPVFSRRHKQRKAPSVARRKLGNNAHPPTNNLRTISGHAVHDTDRNASDDGVQSVSSLRRAQRRDRRLMSSRGRPASTTQTFQYHENSVLRILLSPGPPPSHSASNCIASPDDSTVVTGVVDGNSFGDGEMYGGVSSTDEVVRPSVEEEMVVPSVEEEEMASSEEE